MKETIIHPNTPQGLLKLFRAPCSFHRLADELDVNVQVVHSLITKGIEATDKTEKGRETRHKLFLTKFKKQDKPHKPLTPIQKAIRPMAKSTNNSVLLVRVLRKSKEFTGDQRPSSQVRKQYLSRVRAARH